MSFETPIPPYNASDPHATFLNSSCLDLLLIEMVPMAYRLAHEQAVAGMNDDGGGGGGGGAAAAAKLSADEEEQQREGAFRRLETLGYRVGQGLAER
jgi:hypothetical protein